MRLLAKISNEETKQVDVADLRQKDHFEKIGFFEMEVEQAYDGSWYIKGYAPEKPTEQKETEVRAVRNSYLEKYVDPKQLVLVWNSLTEDEQKKYTDYRQYLLDYPETEGWYEHSPLTFEEWKQASELEQIVASGD